jgi:AcrR family transcriptional regulator
VVAGPGADLDGRSTRWDSHRAERRADLCRAARRAVHHRGPDLSMDEMATAMGTSKSIVYRYFTDKSGLQAAVGTAVLEEMADAFSEAAHHAGPAQERLRSMVAIYVTMLTGSPNVYRFVTRVDEETSTLSTFISTVTEYVAEPLRTVLAETGSDVGLAVPWAAGVVGFVRGAGEQWLAAPPERRPAPESMVDLISTWLWSGASTQHALFATLTISPVEDV